MILRLASGQDARVLLGDLGIRRAETGTAARPVTSDTVAGLPAVSRAITLASEGVAGFELGVWRGRPPHREQVTSTWQARLFRDGLLPNSFRFLEDLEASISSRGNAYVWKVRGDLERIVGLVVMHPDQVQPIADDRTGEITYRVTRVSGYPTPPGLDRGDPTRVVGGDVILHVRGPGAGPKLIAPSPVELYRTAWRAELMRDAYSATFMEHGMQPGPIVSFPREVGPDEARRYKDLLMDEHAGAPNWHKPWVLGGGATAATIGLSMIDAQWVEQAQLGLAQIARMLRVTESLLEGNRVGVVVTPEHELTRWFRYGLVPRFQRIEAALRADEDLFGPGARDEPWFNTAGAIRGDVKSEALRLHSFVQDGILAPDEARAELGYAPHPDGLGELPVITPAGAKPNPDPLLVAAGASMNGGSTGNGAIGADE